MTVVQLKTQYATAPALEPAPRPTWRKVPDALRDDMTIPGDALRVYALLQQWGGDDDGCFAAQATIAAHFGWSERTVRDYLARLEWADWITVQHRGDGQGGRTSNLYNTFASPDDTRAYRLFNALGYATKRPAARKSRAGVGNRNSRSGKGDQRNTSAGKGSKRNSGAVIPRNSRSGNRDGNGIENNKPLGDGVDHPIGDPGQDQTPAGTPPGFKPKRVTDHQRRFAALQEGWGLKGQKLREKERGQIGRLARFLGGKPVKESTAPDADEILGLNPPASPEEITEFCSLYWPWAHPEIAENVPRDVLKVQGHFLKMRSDPAWREYQESRARREAVATGATASPAPTGGQAAMIRAIRAHKQAQAEG